MCFEGAILLEMAGVCKIILPPPPHTHTHTNKDPATGESFTKDTILKAMIFQQQLGWEKRNTWTLEEGSKSLARFHFECAGSRDPGSQMGAIPQQLGRQKNH